MLLVYDMIHDYCHLLKQKASLIEQAKYVLFSNFHVRMNDRMKIDICLIVFFINSFHSYCPEELKEAVSSLLYAAPRCGEFPELKEIRAILTARFGKEVTDGATESRNNSGVCQKMIQKLSSKELSLENRTMMLAEIAKEDGIVLQLDATILPETVEKVSSLSESVSYYSMKSNLDMSDSSPRCDSESDDDEIIEEEEGERLAYDMKAEEFEDLYSDDYSDDDNIKSFEKMDFDASRYKIEKEETGFPSRTVYFSSYKQFPFRHRVEDELCATTGS
ncbi:putative vacuolar protein sorting-associated protein Ist1 [Helianthus annuus]|nr:putative vacuolar protein sorting-associated protein Ist1 [Helianthus annuus]